MIYDALKGLCQGFGAAAALWMMHRVGVLGFITIIDCVQ